MEHVEFDAQRSTVIAEFVRNMLNRRLDRKIHLGFGGECTVMVEAVEPKHCSESSLR